MYTKFIYYLCYNKYLVLIIYIFYDIYSKAFNPRIKSNKGKNFSIENLFTK